MKRTNGVLGEVHMRFLKKTRVQHEDMYGKNAFQETALYNPEDFPDDTYDFMSLSRNPNLTSAFIMKHLDKGWQFPELSKSRAVTEEIVLRTIRRGWNYKHLMLNPNIPMHSEVWEHFARRNSPDRSGDLLRYAEARLIKQVKDAMRGLERHELPSELIKHVIEYIW